MPGDPVLIAPRACRRLSITTTRMTEFIDITDRVEAIVREAGLDSGFVFLQTRHTTTGLLINEAEPLLLEDLAARLSGWAPLDFPYAHDDLSRRTVNVLAGRERRNGHAHCRAALFRTAEWVMVEAGRLSLGRWQRLLFVECDGPQRRELAVRLLPWRDEAWDERSCIERSPSLG